jgi:hypothetical protein
MQAFCGRSGVIDFAAHDAPLGTLPLAAHHNGDGLRQIVEVMALHSPDKLTLLVPGFPESDKGEEKLRAAVRFARKLRERLETL